MKQVKMNIKGNVIDAMLFKTRTAAENYKAKKVGREILFIKAGQYYVSV